MSLREAVDLAMTEACPSCGAKRKKPCIDGLDARDVPHPARYRAAWPQITMALVKKP